MWSIELFMHIRQNSKGSKPKKSLNVASTSPLERNGFFFGGGGWLVGWLVGFYGIATFVGYLTSNLFLWK